jgi:hypothetical protein
MSRRPVLSELASLSARVTRRRDSVRKENECKAKWLFAAVVAEVIAAAGVAGAVGGVLYHALH